MKLDLQQNLNKLRILTRELMIDKLSVWNVFSGLIKWWSYWAFDRAIWRYRQGKRLRQSIIFSAICTVSPITAFSIYNSIYTVSPIYITNSIHPLFNNPWLQVFNHPWLQVFNYPTSPPTINTSQCSCHFQVHLWLQIYNSIYSMQIVKAQLQPVRQLYITRESRKCWLLSLARFIPTFLDKYPFACR